MIYKIFEQWKNGNVLEHGVPRTEYYSEDQLDLVEMGWNYGYDAGRAVEQTLDKKAENARELGLDYEPYAEELEQPVPRQAGMISITVPAPVAYLCENAVGHKYFRWKKPSSTFKPIALYTTPPAQPAQQQGPYSAPVKEMWPVAPKAAAQRQSARNAWVGLTDEDKLHIEIMGGKSDVMLAEMVEAKLKERNT
jgi:hypothetical protein